MKFEVDEPREDRGRIYARPTHEKGLLVVRTLGHGSFVLDRLVMAVSEPVADAVAAGEDIEEQVIEPDVTLSGMRRIIHGHGYVPIDIDRVTGMARSSLPIHEVLELEPTISAQDAAAAPLEQAETQTAGFSLREHPDAPEWGWLGRGNTPI